MGLMMMVGVFSALFGGKGLNHHPTDSCDFGGTRNRTLTTHAQVSGEKALILVDPPTPEENVTQSDHRNFFGWTGCAYAVSLAVSFTQHHMLVDIQSLPLPPRKKWGGCCPSLSHAKSWATTS